MDNNFISAEDVLDRWGPVVKTRVLAMSTDEKNALIERLASHAHQLGDEEWLDVQIDNFARFFFNLDIELVTFAWCKIAQAIIKKTDGSLRINYVKRLMSRPQIRFKAMVAAKNMVKDTHKNLSFIDSSMPPEPKDENDGLASSYKGRA